VLNAKLNVSVNSGSSLLLYVLSFFALNFQAAYYPAIAELYPVAVGALTGAFAGFLVKRNSNNKITLEAERNGIKMTREDPLK
jgi:hypothetical protein